SAELIAAFLHGQEGRNTALARFLALGRRQMLELVFESVFRLNYLFAAANPRKRIGQAMIGLRPDDEIDIRRAAQDFLSLGLRDATRDANGQFLAIRFTRILHLPQTTKRGIELF